MKLQLKKFTAPILLIKSEGSEGLIKSSEKCKSPSQHFSCKSDPDTSQNGLKLVHLCGDGPFGRELSHSQKGSAHTGVNNLMLFSGYLDCTSDAPFCLIKNSEIKRRR